MPAVGAGALRARTADVAVVGAGITGLSAAWHVLQRGLGTVTVVDRDGVGAGASGVQPGGVRQQWGTEVNCRMARDSLRFYRDVRRRLDARVDPRFRPCGYLFVAHTAEQLSRLGSNVELQRRLGIPSALLAPDEAAEVAPALNAEATTGAAFCGEDGYFDRPQGVVEAFAEDVRRRGGEIARGDVVALEPAAAGWSLRLPDGTSVAAGHVVVAAGWETPALLAPLGFSLPVRREERHVFLGAPIRERLLDPLVVSPGRHFAAKQLADGRLLASDLSAEGDPAGSREAWRARVRACIEDLLPVLAFVPLPLLVSGPYDVTPDHQAALGPLPDRETLLVAAGFSGRGFMVAPEAGRALAALVAGEQPEPHIAQLSPDRFERGALVPEPQIV